MFTLTSDLDIVTELASFALDLDTVMEVLLKSCAIKDTVASGTGIVNDELVLNGGFSSGGLGLH